MADRKAKTPDEWNLARSSLARGISFILSRDNSAGAAGTTLQTALAEAINDLDSSQNEGTEEYNDSLVSGVAKGRLQKVQDLKTVFFGDENTQGLFDSLRESSDPPET